MRHAPLALALALALAAAPLHAQEEEPSLLDQGAQLILRGLIEEVAPPLQELAGIADEYLPAFRAFATEMGPAIAEVMGRIDSIAYYAPPEIAPNGDIVIRRRADAPAWVPPPPEPEEPPATRTPRAEPEPRGEPEPEGNGGAFDLTPPPAEGETDL